MFRNSSKDLMRFPKDQPTLADVVAYMERLEQRVMALAERMERLEKKTQGDEG